jgi:hypothetical protein
LNNPASCLGDRELPDDHDKHFPVNSRKIIRTA